MSQYWSWSNIFNDYQHLSTVSDCVTTLSLPRGPHPLPFPSSFTSCTCILAGPGPKMVGGVSQSSSSCSTLTTANPSMVLPSKTAAFVPCQAALAVPSSAPCRSSVRAHMWRPRPTPKRWKCRRQCHSFVTWFELQEVLPVNCY